MAILDITNNEEYKKILIGNKVLVIYSASFCKPCKEIYPYMLELSETYKDIIFIKVDIQKCEDIEDINSILSIPHFRFINNTREICSFTGANRSLIIESIEKLRLSDSHIYGNPTGEPALWGNLPPTRAIVGEPYGGTRPQRGL